MPPTPPTPAGTPTAAPPRGVGGKYGRRRRTQIRDEQIPAMVLQGKTGTQIARELGVHPLTVWRSLKTPDVAARLKELRENQKSLLAAGVTALSEKMVDRIENALTTGDGKELELTTRAALNMERIAASTSGESYAGRGTNVTIQQNTQNVTNIDADLESMLRILYPDGVIDVTPQALNP